MSEVSLLHQQMSSLRNGATPKQHQRRARDAPIKIAILGPLQAGKTKISAQIAGVPFINKYEPTAGVRILELDETVVGAHGTEESQAVELWDCSGDQKFESCWAAICDNLDGCVVAFDPTNKSQANDVRLWCEWFSKRANLRDGQMVIFAHGELSGNHKPLSVRAGERTVVVPIVNTSTTNLPPPDEDGQAQPGPAKVEFAHFLSGVKDFLQNGGADEGDY